MTLGTVPKDMAINRTNARKLVLVTGTLHFNTAVGANVIMTTLVHQPNTGKLMMIMHADPRTPRLVADHGQMLSIRVSRFVVRCAQRSRVSKVVRLIATGLEVIARPTTNSIMMGTVLVDGLKMEANI